MSWYRQRGFFATAVLLCAMLLSTSGFAAEKPRRITRDGLLKRDPVYLSKGQMVAYAVRNESPRLVLAKIAVDGTMKTPQRLYPQATLVEFLPTFSRDEKKHAFMRMTGNDQAVVMLFDGKQLQPIKAAKKVAWNAAISPFGHDLVYNLSGQLYRRNLQSGKEKKLTESSGRNDWPSISPDGKHIAFSSSRNGNYEIYVCRLDGSEPRRLTNSTGLDIRPRWSPDGNRLVFTSNRDRNYEIYVMAADGSGQRRLTQHEERDDYGSWHPDGKRVVFVGERDGLFDLYEMSVPN